MKTQLPPLRHGLPWRQSALMPLLRGLILSALATIPLQHAAAAAPAPTVEFPTATSITYTGATLGGNVTQQGDSAITERGVVYSVTATNSDPQIGGLGVTQRIATLGAGTGVFAVGSSTLVPGTQYTLSAYATNIAGTAYSVTTTFTTPADPPVISSPTVASITTNSATLGGNVTSDNSSAITERGVVYSRTSVNASPAIGGAGVTNVTTSGTTGVFTVPITGLVSTNNYSFRAYATNNVGTSYAAISTFTTLPYAPSVSSPSVASIGITTITLGGNVSSDNSAAITERGVVYSSSDSDPRIGDPGVTKQAVSGTTGVFTTPVTGLQPTTYYYFKAYASNSVGTTYTWTNSFTTLPYAPSVPDTTYSSLGITTVTLGGTVASDNSAAITQRGVVYSRTSINGNPMVGGAGVTTVTTSGTTGVFTIPISGLTPTTNYSFRAFATNSVGTTHSWLWSFTTLPYAPSISSPTSSLVTGRTAVLGATVTSDNSAAITQRGVVYSSTDNDPRINDVGVTRDVVAGTSLGTFTKAVTGLVPRTIYYYRAYATNSVGTRYTTMGTFTTPDVPTVIDPTDASISSTAATLGGNVSSDNLAGIIERGVVYSITASNGDPIVDGPGVTKEVDAGTTGVFAIGITGLANGTTYSYKAYAINSEGTTYTPAVTFRTLPVIPTISTPTSVNPVTNPSTAVGSVTLGGNVTHAGAEVIERGVVYAPSGVNNDPSIGGNGVTRAVSDDHAGTTGAFSMVVTGLPPNVLYSFRAYVQNDEGTSYTTLGTFKAPAVAPLISSPSVGSITTSGVTVVGNVTHDGGLPITARGFVYSATSTNLRVGAANTMTVQDTIGVGEGVAGTFSVSKTGLPPGTTYNYVAYAGNGKGYSYTAVSTFKILGEVPTVTTPSKTLITSAAATLGGFASKANGSDILVRGVVYSSTDPTPTLGEEGVFSAVATSEPGLGAFTAAVTGLKPGTLYYFRARVRNDTGNGYSTVSSFTTLAAAPSVVTGSAGTPNSTSVAVSDNRVSDNGAAVTKYGVLYSTVNTSPKIGGANVLYVTLTGAPDGNFSINLALKAGKRYYYRAYATNRVGTGYGGVASFVAPAAMPTVAAPTDTSVTRTSAMLGGRIASANGAAIIERGVRYWKTANPSEKYKKIAPGTTLGTFAVLVNGLAPGTAYEYEAYAENAEGKAFSTEGTFRTIEAATSALAGMSASTTSTDITSETYYATDAATGLRYLAIVISNASQAPRVEVSGNLTDWFSGSSHTTVLSDDAGILKVRDNTPVTADSKRYIRLRP